MHAFEDLLKESASIHGHLCAGQVLGVRMAMVGCREVGIEEPKGSKKLLVYVEIDRCATDAIRAVTGCSLGKRTLKFLDYGKMAATFVNLATQRAVRVLAKDEARSVVASYVDDSSNQHEAEKKAYALMPEESLFSIQPMKIQIPAEDMPGVRGGRIFCEQCGEGINFKRELRTGGKILCIPCARGSYLPQSGKEETTPSHPKVLLVVGSKKTGKTTLIEKLIPELSQRGYRVGTIKHHHSKSPLEVDRVGKDSWRHRMAGAKAVALVSSSEVAVFRETEETIPLDRISGYLRGVDIVLVEGFGWESRAKIEIRKTPEHSPSGVKKDSHLLAIVCSEKGDGGVPYLNPDDIPRLADLIEQGLLGSP